MSDLTYTQQPPFINKKGEEVFRFDHQKHGFSVSVVNGVCIGDGADMTYAGQTIDQLLAHGFAPCKVLIDSFAHKYDTPTHPMCIPD